MDNVTLSSEKPTLSFWQIWNMSFGFLGIQFGWSLQLANMSAIYEYLGASPEDIPILWLAAPLTGLLVQPVIGYYSDKTWTKFGRRRPYFAAGAILASVALIFMPNSSSIWMAAGLLWVLDASINISMEPFRAFVVDMLPGKQRTFGFTMQSVMIGLGSVVAFALPFILRKFGFGDENESGVAETVKIAFYAGGVVLLGAVLVTIFTTKEYPPPTLNITPESKEGLFKSILNALRDMPKTMKQIAVVQFITWPALFLMWFYFSTAVANEIFGASQGTVLYAQGIEWGGVCFAFYSLVTFGFSFLLPKISSVLGNAKTHLICLIIGGISLISVAFIHNQYLLLLPMIGVGIAWASTLSMPYAILGNALPPHRVGIYMGIFNFFIVIPEIIASLGFGWVMENLLDNSRLSALILAGGLMILAGLFNLRVKETVALPADV